MSNQTDVQSVQDDDLWAAPKKAVRAEPSLVEKLMESDLLPMPIWVQRAIARVRTWGKETPEGYSTGFASLDRYFRFCPEELYLIAARPSQGKTRIVMQFAESVAQQIKDSGEKGCVAIFSAEMSGEMLFIRSAGSVSGVNYSALRLGRGTQEDAERLVEALEAMRDMPIWTDDGAAPSTEKMEDELNRLNDIVPIKMIVFDYLELAGDRDAPNEALRVGKIIMRLKDIAKALKIPVIVLSQLGRQVEERPNKMPTIADARQSGAIEQAIDVGILLMLPWYYVKRGIPIDVPEEDKQGIAYAVIGKNRNGEVAMLKLRWNDELYRFEDNTAVEAAKRILEDEQREQRAAAKPRRSGNYQGGTQVGYWQKD